MRVLIVEDQALLALLLEQDLVDEGHEVVGIARDRPQAVSMAKEHQPSLALVDIQLADGDTGMLIASDIAAPATKVVYLTASSDLVPDDGAGATGHLSKPYALQVLRRTIAYIAHLLGIGDRADPPRELRIF